jgi:hypothetical protein
VKILIHNDKKETLTLLFLLFIVWNLLDTSLTIIGVTGNIAHEQNFLLMQLPIGYAMILKMSLALLVGVWWLKKQKIGRFVLGNILIFGVCIWNILVIQNNIIK